MTRKQQLFCDYYLISLNATEAAKKAGYSERTAKQVGSKNMTNLDIKAYIDDRMAQKTKELIAKQDEVLIYLTKVLRGEENELKPLVVSCGEGHSKVKVEEYTVQPVTRVKAAELLGKRYRLWDAKEEQEKLDINIICDIPRPKETEELNVVLDIPKEEDR